MKENFYVGCFQDTLQEKIIKQLILNARIKSNLFRKLVFFVLKIATLDENTVGPLNTVGERKYLPKRPFGCNNAK